VLGPLGLARTWSEFFDRSRRHPQPQPLISSPFGLADEHRIHGRAATINTETGASLKRDADAMKNESLGADLSIFNVIF